MVRRRAPAAGGRVGGRGGGLRGYLRIPAADLLRRHRRGLRLRRPHVAPAWRGTHGAGGPHRRRRRLVAALGFREVGIYEKHVQLAVSFARWGSTKNTANWTACGATW